ncbi:uncharacterized protein RCC_00571 [Ramularia collo-cygni]|uniref:Uncharacterized protein n=1 Tax=Ramularia collo-cygni TaxID=112498 RepID=A0A2D3UUK8_9PEZI|nr:uncharacterized protein RCC_00571 [Ramularia collo-cygni]CZT14596.1 uncharacterized protein RCC_00571 [Ramularia collo-cygni]
MSDATPASTKKTVKGWTDVEKLGLLFQIIEKAGTIPWAELDLPEGRTQKACSVMVDKEKAKLRKAKEGGDEDGATTATPATPATGGKGKVPSFNLSKEIGKLADSLLLQKRATALDEDDTPAKKPRATPRKSKKAIQAEEAAAAAAEADDDQEDLVKAEVFE